MMLPMKGTKMQAFLERLLRVAIAGAAAATITVLPEINDAIPEAAKPYAAAGIAALLVALDKIRRWGSS